MCLLPYEAKGKCPHCVNNKDFYIVMFLLVPPPQLLLDHQDAIASEHNDPIHELLEDLGEVPTIESLIGQYRRYSIVPHGSVP